MDYQIRKAELSDLEQIQILSNKLCEKEFNEFDNTIDPKYATTERGTEYFKYRLEHPENSFSLVAVVEGKIIGYLIGGINNAEEYRTQAKIGEGETMFIDEEYRGKGIGSAFLKSFEEWCKEKGITRLRLVASSRNIKAVGMYKKQGFGEYDITLEKII